MTTTLVPGQNISLSGTTAIFNAKAGAAADFSAFRLYANGKTRGDEDFIFYGQTSIPDKSVGLTGATDEASFAVNFAALPAETEKIAFAVTSDFPTIASLGQIKAEILADGAPAAQIEVKTAGMKEGALILGEFYKRADKWKFRCVCQGFNEGLKALAENYGVEIADAPKSEQAKPEPPKPTVNLSKITLTKQAPTVDLAKRDIKSGAFRVNLNWHRASSGGGLGRFFGGGGVDLDLGAYVRLKDGYQDIVQALGDDFGSLDREPYVKLMGDDRTGDQSDGEWIYINGDYLDQIAEIVFYAFIYEGVPNWSSTDGVVTLSIPGQPLIETRLEGDNNKLSLCAIARIVNEGNGLRVERLDRYFRGQSEMDRAYGWGFSWSKGSK